MDPIDFFKSVSYAWGAIAKLTAPARKSGERTACFRPIAEIETLVLPEWIEHSTSPLPRGCSTTELRQRKARARGGRRERGGNCHNGPYRRKAKAAFGR
jgi:hypothetical protein